MTQTKTKNQRQNQQNDNDCSPPAQEQEQRHQSCNFDNKNNVDSNDENSEKMPFCQGLDMSLCDYDGRTALHLAAAEGQFACVEVENYDHDDNYCFCYCNG